MDGEIEFAVPVRLGVVGLEIDPVVADLHSDAVDEAVLDKDAGAREATVDISGLERLHIAAQPAANMRTASIEYYFDTCMISQCSPWTRRRS